jgi:hypothetical protein
MMPKYNVNEIARMITEDPNVFSESGVDAQDMDTGRPMPAKVQSGDTIQGYRQFSKDALGSPEGARVLNRLKNLMNDLVLDAEHALKSDTIPEFDRPTFRPYDEMVPGAQKSANAVQAAWKQILKDDEESRGGSTYPVNGAIMLFYEMDKNPMALRCFNGYIRTNLEENYTKLKRDLTRTIKPGQ